MLIAFGNEHLKIRKKSGLLPNRGGGPEVYINNQPPSAIMCFLKWACKTILGPLKHVLHLVWSVYVTSKAIKTALKVELLRFFFTLDASPWLGQIMVSKKKKSKIFFCLKSVSGIIDRFSIKKMKKIFTGKLTKKDQTTPRGGGPRGVWQNTKLFPVFLLETFPNSDIIISSHFTLYGWKYHHWKYSFKCVNWLVCISVSSQHQLEFHHKL